MSLRREKKQCNRKELYNWTLKADCKSESESAEFTFSVQCTVTRLSSLSDGLIFLSRQNIFIIEHRADGKPNRGYCRKKPNRSDFRVYIYFFITELKRYCNLKVDLANL